MKKINTVTLGTISLSAALLLGACSNSVEEPMIEEEPETEMSETEMPTDTDTENNQEADNSTQSEDTVEEKQGLEHIALEVTLDDALDVFFDTFGSVDININAIELDKDDGRYAYKIEGWDTEYEYELTIDAETSEVLEEEKETDIDWEDVLNVESAISPLEAMEAALEASGSGYVDEWELEVENGRMIYDIDISDGNDQKVDALTGAIL